MTEHDHTAPERIGLADTPDDPLATLQGLDPDTAAALHRIARKLELPAGTLLLAEGEVSNQFYIVESGHVTVFRAAEEGREERRVVELGPGELVGEMAVVDGGARSLSARAGSDCRLLMVEPNELLALPDGKRMFADLKGSFGASIVQRLRTRTDGYVKVLEREIDVVRTQQHFGQFFVYMLAMMSIGNLVNNALARKLVHVNIYTQQFAWEYLLILLIPSFFVIKRMGISMDQMGMTRTGLAKSLKVGLIASVVMVALTALLSSVLYLFDSLPGKPLQFELYGTLTYAVHSFLQELIGRGFMQSSFQRFLNDERGIRSVVLSSTLFGMFHLHFGFSAVALTIVSGFVFGAFYLRYPNVAGVTLLHFTSGVCAFLSGLL